MTSGAHRANKGGGTPLARSIVLTVASISVTRERGVISERT